ncbi:MAG: hypothetical protein HQM06_12710 [Magnetococcales bacterium]|nr:hypothetical protein [Magnetococcales bacterium]
MMKISSPFRQDWSAEIAHIAKTVEQIAWQNWLAVNSPANKAIFLAARRARLRAVHDWRLALQQ